MSVNYQNTKIYVVRSPHTDLVYVGMTTFTLVRRMQHHRGMLQQCTSRQIIAFGDAHIELLEEFPCDNKEQAMKKEGEYIRSMNCVNKYMSGRTRKQFYEDNKERLNRESRQYRIDNPEKNKEWQKKYREKNKEKIKQNNRKNSKKFRTENREKHNKNIKSWCDKNRRVCVCGGKYVDIPSQACIHYSTKKHGEWVEGFYGRVRGNSTNN